MATKAKGKQHAKPDPLNAVDAEWQADDYRLFGFTVDQVAIPNLVIVQPTSRMPDKAKHLGEIYNTLTRQFFKRVEVVFIGHNTPRSVFPFPYDPGAKQLCASPDGIAPFDKYIGREIKARSAYDEVTLTVPETCAECPLYDESLCTKMYRYFGLQLIPGDDPMPFAMRLKKSSMQAAQQLNFMLNLNEVRRRYVSYWFSSEEAEGDAGSYYVAQFDEANDASPLFGDAVKMNRALTDRIRHAGQAQLRATNDDAE